MHKFYYVIFTTLFTIVVLTRYATSNNKDLYQVIGVQPQASAEEIKRAYRELARTLHPDKSQPNNNDDNENASNRFAEINRAYSILKDPEKRRRYDQFGETESSRYSNSFREQRQGAPRGGRYRFSRGTFTFYSPDTRFKKISITTKQYYNEHLKDSRTKVSLVFFYMDFCPACSYIEPDWFKITDTLKKYGVDSFSINVNTESQLARSLGVSSIPYITALVDGQLHHYRKSEVSLTNVVKFLRTLLPNNLVTSLQNEAHQDRFILQAPLSNRLSAIILQNDENLRFRYLLLAYELRFNYKFGFISTKLGGHTLFCQKYNISIQNTPTSASRLDRMLVFDEDLNRPRHNIAFDANNMQVSNLKKQLQGWPFLKLPRLISQYTFNDLCLYTIPRDGEKVSRRLCVILFASEAPSSLPSRSKIIEFVQLNGLAFDKEVAFMFIDPLKQKDFVADLLKETQENEESSRFKDIEYSIILIERNAQGPEKAFYKWIENKWDAKNQEEIDRAKLELYDVVRAYKRDPRSAVKLKVILSQLVDEEGPGLFEKILWRIYNQTARMFWYVTSSDSFSSIVLIVLCALGGSLLFYQNPSNYMPNHLNREDVNFETTENNESSHKTKEHISSDDDLRIIELKAETYNGMVRLFRPGCRSIILLADCETKDILLPQFRKAVWPYRRNKTLTFGYLCLDKNLAWFEALLQQVVGVENLKVNKKNCVGTVLSLNGFKKYFRMYHAKHTEERLEDSIFGADQDSDDDVEKGLLDRPHADNKDLPVENLLDRLSIWLDKMFDGITKRYFIDSWPDEIV